LVPPCRALQAPKKKAPPWLALTVPGARCIFTIQPCTHAHKTRACGGDVMSQLAGVLKQHILKVVLVIATVPEGVLELKHVNPKVGRVFDALVDGDSLMAGQVKQVSG